MQVNAEKKTHHNVLVLPQKSTDADDRLYSEYDSDF